MSEKFSLKWDDYQSNWSKCLTELRNDTYFEDVTLISDDKVKFSAHKILLSSCSNLLKFILKSYTHANPLLFLGGVNSVNLRFILDYIYYGEVKLDQEQLDSFLKSAQKLELEGLMGYNNDSEEHSYEVQNYHQEKEIKEEQYKYQTREEEERNTNLNTRRQYSRSLSNSVAKIDVGSLRSEEIEKKMKELYHRIGVIAKFRCRIFWSV